MANIYWKIEHEPWNQETLSWDPTQKTIITDFYDPIISQSLGEGRDTFSMKVTNFNNTKDVLFNPRDKLYVYRKLNSNTFVDADLIMVVLIDRPQEFFTTNSQYIQVKGNNYSEIIMNAITFVDLENVTIPVGIQEAINQVSGTTTEFAVTWFAGNPTLKSDDTSFPLITKRYFNKPLIKVIEEWSTTQATQDGNYYWYVDSQNRFRWFRGAGTTSRDFNSLTQPSLSLTPDVETDVKNVVIAKGGLLPNRNQVQIRYTDWSSFAKYGNKPHILISENNTVSELTKLDYYKSFGPTQNPDNYPDLTNNFTTAWRASMPSQIISGTNFNDITVVKGSTITISDSTETRRKNAYNALLNQEVRFRLVEESKKYLETRASGKFKLNRAVRAGTLNWGLGDRIQSIMPSKYSGIKELRVTDIQYTDNVDTYTLIEDTGTI